MIYCSKCGTKNNDTANFCRDCGNELKGKAESHEVIQANTTKNTSYFKKMFYGRMNRRNFLVGTLLLYVIIYAGGFLFGFLYGYFTYSADPNDPIFVLIELLMLGLLIFYGLSLAIRRSHDLGKGGGYIGWSLIPILGIVININLLFGAGKDRQNKYGPVPKPRIDLSSIFGF